MTEQLDKQLVDKIKNKEVVVLIQQYNQSQYPSYEEYGHKNEQQQQGFQQDLGEENPAAIYKSILGQSIAMQRYINYFQENKGFDNLIKRLQDDKNRMPINIAIVYVQGLTHNNQDYYFSIYFLNEFLPKLKEALYFNITKSSEANIRLIKQETYEDIKKTLYTLMEKVNFNQNEHRENQVFLERFALQTAIICLNFDSLQQKFCAIQWVNQVLDDSYKKISTDELKKWLLDNQIFQKIFDEQSSHEQILINSDILLKFMLKEQMLEENHIDNLVTLCSKNQETFKCLCKVLDKVAYYLDVKHVQFFINKMLEDKINLTKDHIELIFNIQNWIHKYNRENSETVQSVKNQVIQFYKSLIFNPEIQNEINQEASQCLGKMIKSESKDAAQLIRQEMLQECLNNLEMNQSVGNSLKLIKEILNTFYMTSFKTDPNSVQNCALKLVYEQKLLQILLKNIQYVKQQFKKSLQNSSSTNIEKLYLEKISERIQFIKYIIEEIVEINNLNNTEAENQMPYLLDFDILNQYWQEFEQNFFVKQETDIFYNFISDLTKNSRNVEIFLKIFEEKMFQDENKIKNMNFNQFDCFKNLFTQINQIKGNLLQSKKQQDQDVYYYQQNQQFNDKDLYVYETASEEVFQKSSEFYIQINSNLSTVMELYQDQIKKEIFNELIENFNQQNLKLNQQKESLEFSPLINSLYFLVTYLGESEQKGFGNLKSHSGLIQGDLITFQLKNEFNSYKIQQDNLKIWSNQTILELRKQIAKIFNTQWDKTKIKVNDVLIQDRQNGRTISDLKLKDLDKLIVQKREIKEKNVPHAFLLEENGQYLTPKAKLVFTEIFLTFSNEKQQMYKENCVQFLNACFNTNDQRVDSDIIQQVYSNYDKENKGYLSISDFLRFYTEKSPKNEDSEHVKEQNPVFKNLKQLGYRRDLKKESEINEKFVDIQKLPRYILAQNEQFYDKLFALLEKTTKHNNQQAQNKIIDLLNYLPTSKKIYQEIKNFEGIINQQKPIWAQIFQKESDFELEYNLVVIAHLITGGEDEIEEKSQKNQKNQTQDQIIENTDQVNKGEIQQSQKNENENQGQQLKEEEIQEMKLKKSSSLDSEQEKMLKDIQDQELKEYFGSKDEEWSTKFIQSGGFQQLQKIFEQMVDQSQKIGQKNQVNLNNQQKNILGLILNIIKTYLTAIYSRNNLPQLFQKIAYLRLPIYNISLINEYLEEDKVHQNKQLHNKAQPQTSEKNLEKLLKLKKQIESANSEQDAEINVNNNDKNNYNKGEKSLKRKYEINCAHCKGELVYKDDPYAEKQLSYICDICCKTFDQGEGSFHCDNCNSDITYDVCEQCYNYEEDNQEEGENKKDNNQCEKDQKNQEKPPKIHESIEFQILAEKLVGNLGQTVLDSLDLKRFQEKVLNILIYIIKLPIYQEEKPILEFGLCILLANFKYSQDALKSFMEQQQSEKLILFGILKESEWVRELFHRFLFILQREDESIKLWLANILINNMPNQSKETSIECNEFYQILCKVLENQKISQKIDMTKLFEQIITNIGNHQSTEISSDYSSTDKILAGYLQIAETLLTNNDLCKGKGNLASELFNSCLFTKSEDILKSYKEEFQNNNNINPINYFKCKLKWSRKPVYNMVIQLLKNNQDVAQNFIIKDLKNLIDQVPSVNEWNYLPEKYSKSFTGFSGIHNIQNICYMNSMIQQCFLTKYFRYGIIAANDNKEPNQVEYDGGLRDYKEQIFDDDNLLHQLQKMFGFLLLTDRKFYNPLEFCFSMKDFDGQPCNVLIQQDSQEFLNMFFDKIENSLKNSIWRDLVINIFGGKMSAQLICKGCGHIKENLEKFYTWSLPVQNKTKLEQSLQSMVEGEIISDYKCDNCQKKQDIQKRVLMNDLPNFLVLHLQRIIFDMNTFLNKKISDKFEFPLELDVQEYTKSHMNKNQNQQPNLSRKTSEQIYEQQKRKDSTSKYIDNQTEEIQGQSKDYFKYKLKGVVVHSGTAEGGHYFSYINTEGQTWREFNDSLVREFDPKNIEKECFGGSTNNNGFYEQEKGDSSSNAYILIYEKIEKKDMQFKIENQEELKELTEKLKDGAISKSQIQKIQQKLSNKEQENIFIEVDPESIKGDQINTNLKQEVWLDNHQFLLQRFCYNEQFFDFINGVLNSLQLPAGLNSDEIENLNPQIYKDYQTIPKETKNMLNALVNELIPNFIFKILVRANDNMGNVSKSFNYLVNFLRFVPQYAGEFFISQFDDQMEYFINTCLIKCPDIQVKKYVQKLIIYLINFLLKFHNITSLIDHQQETDQNVVIVEKINDLLIYMADQLNYDVAKFWDKNEQYLQFWVDFINSGETQIEWCFKNDLIARMIDFMLQDKSPMKCYGKKQYTMGSKSEYGDEIKPDFKQIFFSINKLISMADISTEKEDNKKLNEDDKKKYILSENDSTCILNVNFCSKFLENKTDEDCFNYIIKKSCYNNYENSKVMAEKILDKMKQTNAQNALWVDTFKYYMSIQDDLQDQRLEWIFGIYQVKENEEKSFALKPFYIRLSAACIQSNSTIDNNILSFTDLLYKDSYSAYSQQQDSQMVLIMAYLTVADENKYIFEYTANLPPISYLAGYKFTDSIKKYIEDYKKSISSSQSLKQEIYDKCTYLMQKLEEKHKKYVDEGKFLPVQQYILGHTIETKEVSNEELIKDLFLEIKEVKINLVENKNDINKNCTLVFPSYCMDTDNSVDNRKIPLESNIYKIILQGKQNQHYQTSNENIDLDKLQTLVEIQEDFFIKKYTLKNMQNFKVNYEYFFEFDNQKANFYANRCPIRKTIEANKEETFIILHKRRINEEIKGDKINIKILKNNSQFQNSNYNNNINYNNKKPQIRHINYVNNEENDENEDSKENQGRSSQEGSQEDNLSNQGDDFYYQQDTNNFGNQIQKDNEENNNNNYNQESNNNNQDNQGDDNENSMPYINCGICGAKNPLTNEMCSTCTNDLF
ncbi:hypothetical protein PPERSA_06667 [Pseudocohnilembus persalinus]|uniref:USP domain-containing protein n=1 Tax=Pseudocohnilembus persalinus TaxID=266149 RepID=A0A0V0QRX1_PSEPJ|nr:hypothetical protein PPERSA_06667 [Pseudocohnilembus persalinus]|eukprot:KRX05033.1 hypothetical protein PPERSA_06667 [Pseudocohnilembus persalinus]